jgi:glycerol-3-phosphate acyltransferase PlsY
MVYPISWEFAWPYLLAALGGGYLAGSIPFGLLVARMGGLGDVRQVGSGNIGATNVLRTGRKGLAAATFVLDTAKGWLAVLIAGIYGPDMAVLAASGAIIGHMFPLWLKFCGGKGVATGFGVLLGLTWPVALGVVATWIAVLAMLRYSSLSALVASAAAPFLACWLADPQRTEFAVFLAVMVWIRHWPNIKRLVRGEESKVGNS